MFLSTPLRRLAGLLALLGLLLAARFASAQVPPGNALTFDGIDDYVALPNATAVPTGNGTYTLEAWIKPNAMGVYGIIGWGNWGTTNQVNALRLSPTGIINYWWGPDLIVTTPDLSGRWHYVAATFDGTTRTIYLDGAALGSDTPGSHTVPSASNLRIGCTNGPSPGGGYEYFPGSIDEVRIWNVARTAAQVKAAYTSWPAAPQTGLVAAYGCNQGTAGGSNAAVTSLTDQSGNAYNGTLTNFALSGSTSNWVESYALVVPMLAAATAVTTTGFTVNWTAPASGTVSSYVLDYSTSPTFATVAGTVSPAAGATSQALNGLQFNTSYYYRLRADKASVSGTGAYATTSPVRTPGVLTPPGNALAFDGSNDYVAVNSPAALSNLGLGALTMESWAYCTNLPGVNSIIRKSGDYNLVLLPGGKLYAEVWPAGTGNTTRVTATALDPIEANRWTHLAATWDGSTLRLYVNGALVSFTQTSSPLSTSESLWLGRSAAYNQPFSGRLDEVRLYSAALTAAQLQADLASTSAAVPGSLLAYYNFDQGTAGGSNTAVTSLTDQSTTQADGTLTGFDLGATAGNTTSNWVESYALVVPRLAAPTGGTSTGFTANWTAPALGTVDNGYRLDVATSRDFAAASLVAGSPITVTGTSQAVTGLSASQTYYYRVRADKASVTGQGAYSATGVRAPFTPMTPPGNALAFDGVDDQVLVPDANGLDFGAADFTVESWVMKQASSSGYSNSVVMGKWNTGASPGTNEWLLSPTVGGSDDLPCFWVESGTTTYQCNGVLPLSLNKWHHLVGVRQGATLLLYVDGQLQASRAIGTAAVNNVGRDLLLGRSAAGAFTNLRLDEARLWNVARTAAQVQAAYTNWPALPQTGLVAAYNFDQGTAGGANAGYTTLTDQSGNGYAGTLTGFDLSSGNTVSNWVESYALVVPGLTAATGTSSTGFTANWTAPALGTVDNGYRLDVATSRAFTASSLVAGSPFSTTGTSQAVTGLDPAQTYYYRVRPDKASVTGQGASSATGVRPVAIPVTPPGNALAFDGSDDYVSGNNSQLPQGNAARTLEAWVLTTQTSNGVVVNYGTATSNLRSGILVVNGKAYYVGEGNDLQGTKVVNDGHWHHVAATYDGTTLKLYVDGVLDVSSTPTAFNTTGFDWNIGKRIPPLTSTEQFNGRLDEVRVYSAALSQAQVQADMTSTSPAVAASLVAYYNFDQGAAGGANAGYTTLTDQSGNGNFGTLTNFSLGSGNTTSNWVESYALLQPTNLAASATTGTGFTASWTAPLLNGAAPASGAVEGYVLDVSMSSTFASGVTSFATSGYGTTSVAATGLANGTDYYVRVRAEKASVTGQGAVTPALKVHLVGTDALLSNLTASGGVLSPTFATNTLTYTLYVPGGASTFTLTPTASNAYTGIAVNGTAVASGTASGALPVSSPATVVLTSEDGNTTRTYTVQPVAAPTYFRSVATGNWGDAATWEALQDGSTSWFAAPMAPTGSYVGTATVRSGHVVTVAAATSTKTTTIESGGIVNTLASQTLTIPSGATLTVNAGGVLSIGRLSGTDGVTGTSTNLGTVSVAGANALTVNGTLVLNASSTPASQGLSASTTTVGSGGRVVQYASAVNISMPALTWQAGSTLELAGGAANQYYASVNQTLQNLDVNLTTLSAINPTSSTPYLFVSGQVVTVAGTLTVRSTGTAALRLFNAPSSGSLTLGSVDGSGTRTGGYVQQAGTSVVGSFGGSNSTTATPITVQGSFQLSGGTFAAALAVNTATTTLRATPLTVNGDLTVASGATLNLLSAAIGPAVNYAGGTVALNGNFSNAGTVGTGNTASTTQKLLFGRAGTLGAQVFSNTGTITGLVNVATTGTAILDMGSSALTGSGTFTTVAGSTLRLGSPAGISPSGTATGNVQSTGTRTYGGNFEFNGAAAQVTGTGFPATVATAVAFNNPAGVALSQALAVTGTLSLRQGAVTTTATNLLTLGSSGSALGTLDATATNTGYVVGPLKRWVPASATTTSFPVGTGAISRPASITYDAAPTAAGTLTAEFVPSDPGSNGLPLTEGGKNINKAADQGFWRVTAADGLAGGTYTPSFTYTNLARTISFNPADVVLLKRPDASQPWSLQGTPVTTTGPATAPVLSRSGLSAFSEFTAGGDAAGPLPVQLVSFTAAPLGAAVSLSWLTASELDSQRFEVERSPDGTSFEKIGTVAAAGSSSSLRQYAYTDAALPTGGAPLYYRLRQVDQNGAAHYSPVRVVRPGSAAPAGLTLYPNPARSAATLYGAEAGALVRVLDALGRLVLTATADASGTAPLALPAGLPAGVYLARSGRQVVRLTVE